MLAGKYLKISDNEMTCCMLCLVETYYNDSFCIYLLDANAFSSFPKTMKIAIWRQKGLVLTILFL